jgi:hypothetical protein
MDTPKKEPSKEDVPGGSLLFIFSSPRSGSTLLISILDARDEIRMNGERRDFLWNLHDLHGNREELMRNSPKAFDDWQQQREDGHCPSHINHSTDESWNGMVRSVLKAWINPPEDAKWWGMKDVHIGKACVQYAFALFSWIMEVMPDARMIFLTRDIDSIETSMGYHPEWWVSYGKCPGAWRRNAAKQHSAFEEFNALNPDTTALLR